jgi:hypothetical protein
MMELQVIEERRIIMKSRLGSIDRNTAISILEQRGDIDHARATQIVDKIQSILDELKSMAEKDKITGSSISSHIKTRLENKLRNYIDSMDRRELNYEDIKGEIELLFHDPRAGADLLIHRLKTIDRDTIKAIIASRRDLSDEDAEKMLQKIESIRDEAIKKAEYMKTQVEEKLATAQEEAAHITEQTRKNAATAQPGGRSGQLFFRPLLQF